MRIPTLLALTMLFTAVTLGLIIFFYNQQLQRKGTISYVPQKVSAVNITDTSVALTWQTGIPAIGEVIFGSDPLFNLGQNQKQADTNNNPGKVHLAAITGLKPDTQYYYKIRSDKYLYPDSDTLKFRTASPLSTTNLNKPVIGIVTHPEPTKIAESLVFLKINGASEVAAITQSSGNFVLPLNLLRSADLTQTLALQPKTEAVLIITDGELEARTEITLPLEDQLLPPILLGQNLNLKNYHASSSAQITPSAQFIRYDLNRDGKVNAVDLSMTIDSYGKKGKNQQADFNGDGIVNQKDIDLVKKSVQ